MDLTQWFCWITVAGAIIGLIAAIQQLLLHGWLPFIRAAAVALVIGLAFALIYPNIQVRTAGGGTPVALAVNTTPLTPASLSTAPAPLEPATDSVAKAPLEPAAPRPVAPQAAAAGSATLSPATPEAGRTESPAFKPVLPLFLPAQQTLFSPSEVAYCPDCFSAYSAKGPTVGVKCVHCGKEVSLVSSRDYMVYRCSKCGKLYRTSQFPPLLGPYRFPYYCPFCKETHWFPK